METKKRKILSSILVGKIKVDASLLNYKNLSDEVKKNPDMELQNNTNLKFNQFQIDLYNYVRAIKDQKEYFEKFDMIDNILNEIIEPKTLKQATRKYTFYELYNVFRNKNEHYDKINAEEQFKIFKTSIPKEKFFELYENCNYVLLFEINKLTPKEIPSFLLSNIEFKTNYENTVITLRDSNEKIKEENVDIYKLNIDLIKELQDVDFDNVVMKQIDDKWFKFREYLLKDEYKNEFTNRYGKDLYEKLINLYNDDESSIEEDKEKLNEIIKYIINIENQKNTED